MIVFGVFDLTLKAAMSSRCISRVNDRKKEIVAKPSMCQSAQRTRTYSLYQAGPLLDAERSVQLAE